MSDSNWRISLRLNDKTSKVLPSAGAGIGYTVINAPRGKVVPTRFSPGESTRIIQNFGTPNKDNKELLEALYYNDSYPIFISAPSVNGKTGALAVTATGIVALPEGSLSEDFSNFAAISQGKDLGVGDGVTVTFNETFDHLTLPYNNDSFNIFVDGVSVGTIDFTDTASGQTIAVADAGTYDGLAGVIDTDNGTFAVTFPGTAIPVAGEKITISWTTDASSVAYFIKNSAPQLDDLGVDISYDTVTSLFTINVSRKDQFGVYSTIINGEKGVSLDPDSKDGFGISNYILNALESDFFDVVLNPTIDTFIWTGFTDTVAPVDMAGGDRGDIVSGADLAAGYDYAKQPQKYAADIFFDATADDTIPAVFNTLRNDYQHFSKFIIPLPAVDVDDAKVAFTALSVSNRGISCYWNWGIIRNLYASSGNVASALTGEVAKKHADTVINGFGGIAPAWIDENGMGGEMSSGRIVEMIYDADEAQLKDLDDSRINPVVQDPVYGVLIKSRRTTQLALTDYSFIGYSGAADYILKNISQQVLPYQLIKFNDAPHRDNVRSKANAIITPMTVIPVNVIENFAVKCDLENNDEETRNREEFVLSVAVQFTRKSRTIIFNFINTPVGSDIEEAFA